MAFSWVMTTVTRVNPFDGSNETMLEVDKVEVNGVATGERYTFAVGTSTADVDTKVRDDLVAKGYAGVV